MEGVACLVISELVYNSRRYQKWMVIQSLRLLPVLMVGVY